MGVHNFKKLVNRLLKRKSDKADIYDTISVDTYVRLYNAQSIGVDGNLMAYRYYKTSKTVDETFYKMYNSLVGLRKHFKHVYVVFDGPKQFSYKKKTHIARATLNDNLRLRIEDARLEYEHAKRYSDDQNKIRDLRDTFIKRAKQSNYPNNLIISLFGFILHELGFSVCFAISEGDFVLKWLYDTGKIQLIYSLDSDFIAMGIPTAVEILHGKMKYFDFVRFASDMRRIYGSESDIGLDSAAVVRKYKSILMKCAVISGNDFVKRKTGNGEVAIRNLVIDDKLDDEIRSVTDYVNALRLYRAKVLYSERDNDAIFSGPIYDSIKSDIAEIVRRVHNREPLNLMRSITLDI